MVKGLKMLEISQVGLGEVAASKEADQLVAHTPIEPTKPTTQAPVEPLIAAFDKKAAVAGLVWNEEFNQYVKPFSHQS